jgi:cold shock CspA family protein
VFVPKALLRLGRSQKAGELNASAESRRRIKVMKRTGILNVWFPDRNFGFIHEDNGTEIVSHFLHVSNIFSGNPITGATVEFQTVTTAKGTLAVKAEVKP